MPATSCSGVGLGDARAVEVGLAVRAGVAVAELDWVGVALGVEGATDGCAPTVDDGVGAGVAGGEGVGAGVAGGTTIDRTV